MACPCEECLGPRGQNPLHVLLAAELAAQRALELPPAMVSPLAAEPAAVPPSFVAYTSELFGEF